MIRTQFSGNETLKLTSIPYTQDDIYIWARRGDRFDKLAKDYYGNSSWWWILRHANPNSFGLYPTPGIQLRIPSNSNGRLLSLMQEINQ